MFNIISINSRSNKSLFKLRCTKNNRKYLDILNQLNVLEYCSANNRKDTYDVKLMYHKGVCNLQSIKLVSLANVGNKPNSFFYKELNSKKAMYIVNTAEGVKALDNIPYPLNVNTIMFKVVLF